MNIKSKTFPVVAQMFMCLTLVSIVLVNVTMAKTFFLPDVTTDQRGISRLQRKPFDIGAFESFNVSIIPFLTPLLFE